jgi:hypothetical protein
MTTLAEQQRAASNARNRADTERLAAEVTGVDVPTIRANVLLSNRELWSGIDPSLLEMMTEKETQKRIHAVRLDRFELQEREAHLRKMQRQADAAQMRPTTKPPAPLPVAKPAAATAKPAKSAANVPAPPVLVPHKGLRLEPITPAYYTQDMKDGEFDSLVHYRQHTQRVFPLRPLASMKQQLEQRVDAWTQHARWQQSHLFTMTCPPGLEKALLLEESSGMTAVKLSQNLTQYLACIEHAGAREIIVPGDRVGTLQNTLPVEPKQCTYDDARRENVSALQCVLRFRVPFAPHLVQSLLLQEQQQQQAHPIYFAVCSLEAMAEVYQHDEFFVKLADPWNGPSYQWMHPIRALPFLGDVHCVGAYVDGADSMELKRDRYWLLGMLQSLPLPSLQDLFGGETLPWKALFPDMGNVRAETALFPNEADRFLWLQEHLQVLNSFVERHLSSERFLPPDTSALERRMRCTRAQLVAFWGSYVGWRYHGAALWHQMAASFGSYLFHPGSQSLVFARLRLKTEQQLNEFAIGGSKKRHSTMRYLKTTLLEPMEFCASPVLWRSVDFLWVAALLHAYSAQYGDMSMSCKIFTALVAAPVYEMSDDAQRRGTNCPQFSHLTHVPVSAPLSHYCDALKELATRVKQHHQDLELDSVWRKVLVDHVTRPFFVQQQAPVAFHEGKDMEQQMASYWLAMVEQVPPHQQLSDRETMDKFEMLGWLVGWVNERLPECYRLRTSSTSLRRLSSSIPTHPNKHTRFVIRPESDVGRWRAHRLAQNPAFCPVPSQKFSAGRPKRRTDTEEAYEQATRLARNEHHKKARTAEKILDPNHISKAAREERRRAKARAAWHRHKNKVLRLAPPNSDSEDSLSQS